MDLWDAGATRCDPTEEQLVGLDFGLLSDSVQALRPVELFGQGVIRQFRDISREA
jgi:hypothetical protein